MFTNLSVHQVVSVDVRDVLSSVTPSGAPVIWRQIDITDINGHKFEVTVFADKNEDQVAITGDKIAGTPPGQGVFA